MLRRGQLLWPMLRGLGGGCRMRIPTLARFAIRKASPGSVSVGWAAPGVLGQALARLIAYATGCLVLVASQCGCTPLTEYIHNGFKVGPNYQKPPAPVAPTWIDAADQRVRTECDDLSKW